MKDVKELELKVTDLFAGDIELVSPPIIYFELDRVISSLRNPLLEASKIIEKDPNLTAKLLKMVNSAYFGFPSQITTISRAISMIGLTELKNMVLGSLVMDRFSELPGGLMSIKEFWVLSLRTAIISKEFYRQISAVKFSSLNAVAESIFICALLHEIGLLVFYRKIPELARNAGLQAATTGVNDATAEQQLIGFDHYETGAELARLWKLPNVISTTIQFHQHPELAGKLSGTTSMIKLASQISRKKLSGQGVVSEPDLNLICLTEMEINEIIHETDEHIDELVKIYFPGQ
jgi:HD-like signal output (HDOD) protein